MKKYTYTIYGTFKISELHRTGRTYLIDDMLRELKGE